MRWDEFYQGVKQGLRSKNLDEKLDALEKFREEDYDKAAEFLIALVSDGREASAVLRKAAEVLSGYDDTRARALFDDVIRRGPERSAYLLQAYLREKRDNGLEVGFAALERARENLVKKVALEGIAFQGEQSPEQVKKVMSYLDDGHYHSVRKAAAVALGKMESVEQISALIGLLDDRVIGGPVRDSLLRLTGQEHWWDQAAWKTWWSENGASYHPFMMEDEAFAKLHAKLTREKGAGVMAAEFYDREVTGKNILFLLDCSGSMLQPAYESSGSRLDRLKSELEGLLEQLDEEYELGFVLFPHDALPSRGIAKLDTSFLKKAGKFIEDLEAEGPTPMGEALNYSYLKVVAKYNVDTIYLLSDGEPTDVTEAELMIRMMGFVDDFGVTVNTISIGEQSNLLEEIARLTGGKYWEAQ